MKKSQMHKQTKKNEKGGQNYDERLRLKHLHALFQTMKIQKRFKPSHKRDNTQGFLYFNI